MKWSNTIPSIQWKIQIVLYSTDVAMQHHFTDLWEDKWILSAGTVTFLVPKSSTKVLQIMIYIF